MRKYKDREWLETQYQEKTQEEIAELCGVTRSTIVRWMQKLDIETRDGWQQADGKYKQKSWLTEKYVNENQSVRELADECDVSKATITHWMDKFDIDKRNKSEAAEIRAERYPNTWGTENIRDYNWWESASQEEREEFREWLSEQRQGGDNPMSGITGPDNPRWKENKPDYRIYQSDAWRETRRKALEKANHKCEDCGETEQLIGHHVIPLSDGGKPFDVENVCILCRSCHQRWEGLYLRPDTRG